MDWMISYQLLGYLLGIPSESFRSLLHPLQCHGGCHRIPSEYPITPAGIFGQPRNARASSQRLYFDEQCWLLYVYKQHRDGYPVGFHSESQIVAPIQTLQSHQSMVPTMSVSGVNDLSSINHVPLQSQTVLKGLQDDSIVLQRCSEPRAKLLQFSVY